MKATDRICCRHFNDDDIDRFWTHTINGTVEKIERERAVLKKDAVPSKNLTLNFEKTKHKKRSNNDSESNEVKAVISSKKLKSTNSENLTTITNDQLTNVISLVEEDENSDKNITNFNELSTEIIIVQSESVAEKKEAFETFYDEIFDVTLPSPLWGVHRDPDGSFAVFTKLSLDKLEIDRAVRIDDSWKCTIKIGGSFINSKTLKSLDSEALTELLDEVDQIS